MNNCNESHLWHAFQIRTNMNGLAKCSTIGVVNRAERTAGLLDVTGTENDHETNPASTALGDGDTACLPGSRHQSRRVL